MLRTHAFRCAYPRGSNDSTAVFGEADSRASRPLRRDESRWRHDWSILIAGVQREGAVLTGEAVSRGCYSPVPNCWPYFEFPGGFYVVSPREAFLWGVELEGSPYRAGDTPRERGAWSNA